MAERDAPRPPSSRTRDVAGEDFLFHLYRGSELLQDNRVHDAKAELEQALSLQPMDAKGQDLLGIVYFRLGLYPRAIAIYEQLIKLHPDAVEPRINLALSYLKTGQPAQARFELEKVVEQSPGHSRAWGYLGLAFQRLGDYERASYAFQAGGHDGMARRLIEMAAGGGAVSIHPEPPAPTKAEMRKAAGEALAEMDREAPFRTDEGRAADADVRIPAAPAAPTGPWQAVEPGRAEPAREVPPAPIPSLAPANGTVRAVDPVRAPEPPASVHPRNTAPRRPADAAREALLVFPRDLPLSLHASGLVLVQATNGFATRLEGVRSISSSGGQESSVLQRRARGRVLDEPLGGPASPLVSLPGKVGLVLGPSPGQRLWPVVLEDEAIYLREDALVGFEASVSHENGRLPVGDGDAIAMVQLRGPGAVVAQVPVEVAAIEVSEGRTTAVRAVSVLGWIGRIVPRGLAPSEAPGGAAYRAGPGGVGNRGFVAFAGEGMVLVDGR
jgi:Tetratricopeptide repeat